MREIDELLTEVLPLAPSCPEPIAIRYLREAAIELASKARHWKQADTLTMLAPDFECLVPFEDARVLSIEEARFEGQRLDPIDSQELDRALPGWQGPEPLAGTPRYITQIHPGTITLAPRMAGNVWLRCVLVPSNHAMTLPDFLVENHGIEIGKGALARVLTHPNGEWSNPQLGGLYLAEFQAILARAHRKALKGQANAPLRTKASFF